MIRAGLSALMLLAWIETTAAADWLQFRGPGSSGVATGATPPTTWSKEKNIAWKADLPGRGLSSPIVVGNLVVVTSNSGYRQDQLHILAFDRNTGKLCWQKDFWATGQTISHPKTCMAAPTPVSDGKHIFALFASNDVFCVDLAGKLRWLRGLTHDYPGSSDSRGLASSPVIVGNTVIVQVENHNTSFAIGLEANTGVNRWKIDRPKEPSWASPLVLKGQNPGEEVVLLQNWKKTTAHEPHTGKELWSFNEDCNAIPSSLVAGDTVYVPALKALAALKPNAVSRAPEVLWKKEQLGPAPAASPILYNDRLYVLRGAILSCGDPKTGEVLWKLRLKGPFSSSIVAAGGHLYCFSEDGVAQVVKPGEKEGQIVSTNALGETILCTPAIADGAIYVRSDSKLWKLEEKKG